MKQLMFNVLNLTELNDILIYKLLNFKGESVSLNVLTFLSEYDREEAHCIYFDINKSVFDMDWFQNDIVPRINLLIQTKTFQHDISLIELLVYACKFDVIPEGNYIIKVSWSDDE